MKRDEDINKIPAEFRSLFEACLHREIFSLQEEIGGLKKENSYLKAESQFLKEEIRHLQRRLYSSKSERRTRDFLPPGHPTLFTGQDEIKEIQEEAKKEDPVAPTDSQNKDSESSCEPKNSTKSSKKKGGRRPLPEGLPRVRILHDIPEADKSCPHDGATLSPIGEEVVEVLHFVPSRLEVQQHVYPKYACKTCESHMAKAPAAPTILPKTQCSPELLSQVILAKFFMSLPLYRQEQVFKQMGVDLSRTTLARWVIAAAEAARPLVRLIKEFLIALKALHGDETPLQVLKGTGKKPQSKTYLWGICSPSDEHPAFYFEYHPDRSAQSAVALLGGFTGHLHVDGFQGYNILSDRPGVTRVACWAHARRKFDVAEKDGSTSGTSLSAQFLDHIQTLFKLEKEWQNLSPEERLRNRAQFSAPVVASIRALLDENSHKVPPRCKLGLAMGYLANNWPDFTVFLTNGRCALHNNRMENAIRPIAIGRKNFLFCDTVDGAHACATFYSLITTAKANGLPLDQYLSHIFHTLPTLPPGADLTPLLPWNKELKNKLNPTL